MTKPKDQEETLLGLDPSLRGLGLSVQETPPSFWDRHKYLKVFAKILWLLFIFLLCSFLFRLTFKMGVAQGQFECRLECCRCTGLDAGLHHYVAPERQTPSLQGL